MALLRERGCISGCGDYGLETEPVFFPRVASLFSQQSQVRKPPSTIVMLVAILRIAKERFFCPNTAGGNKFCVRSTQS